MLETAFVILIYLLIILIMYIPVLASYINQIKSQKLFDSEISKLYNLYNDSIIIITDKLGEGHETEQIVSFEQVHKHQDFALKTILDLV